MPTKKSSTPQPTYSFHPLADAFELLSGGEYAELIEDIRRNGLLEPIVLHENMILDGRNRYRACLEAGVAPAFRPFTGDDPAAFVESANAHRRHLTPEGKRAALEKLIKLRPELSDRRIAEQTGFSNTHVGKVRHEMEAAGTCQPVDTSIDTKGRTQPRQRKHKGKTKDGPANSTAKESKPHIGPHSELPGDNPAVSQSAAEQEGLAVSTASNEPVETETERNDHLIREGEAAATRYLAETRQAAVSGSIAVDVLQVQIERLTEEKVRLASEVEKLQAALSSPDVYTHASWKKKSPTERQCIVGGWGPSIVAEMSLAVVCGSLPVSARVKLEHRAAHRLLRRMSEMPEPEKRITSVAMRLARKALNEIENEHGQFAEPAVPETPPAEAQPPATAVVPLSPKEATAIASRINRQNTDTSWRVESDGSGGFQRVSIDPRSGGVTNIVARIAGSSAAAPSDDGPRRSSVSPSHGSLRAAAVGTNLIHIDFELAVERNVDLIALADE